MSDKKAEQLAAQLDMPPPPLVRTESQRKKNEAPRGRSLFDSAPKNNFRGLDPNFYYRVFADYPGRLDTALDMGYVFVGKEEVEHVQGFTPDNDLGNRISAHAGMNGAGAAMRAYLMKIPMSIWQEQEASRQSDINELEAQIEGGNRHELGNKAYSNPLTNKISH